MRGVFLHKSTMGYTIVVDGHDIGMDGSWSQAHEVGEVIAKYRKPGDGRGFARCRHEDNTACFKATVCVRLATDPR